MTPEPGPRHVRFGLFELDLKTGELRKRGTRIRLQEQPFQVLAMLVQRAGDLVTREELRSRLWPDAVFVDFDQGLNKAVAKVRSALGDLAESPRYVETLERRGYRFIAPAEPCEPCLSSKPAEAEDPSLVRLTWDDRGFALAVGTHLIGRDPAVAVWINSPEVSRRHAALVVSTASVTIEDLGSRNGTFVNGTRVADSPVRDGDEICIGPARLRVRTAAETLTRTAQ